MRRASTILAPLALATVTLVSCLAVPAHASSSPPDPNVPGNPGFKDPFVVDVSQLPAATQQALALEEQFHPISNGEKSQLVQDSAWVARKRAYQVPVPWAGVVPGSGAGSKPQFHAQSNPRSSIGRPWPVAARLRSTSNGVLNSSITANVVEPLGSMSDGTAATDDAGQPYIDKNYWYYCGPGSSNVALYYWNLSASTTSYPAGTYNDGTAKTYWTSKAPYRSYTLYLAQNVNPPSYKTPGEITYDQYGTGTYAKDIRDALNWEASQHNSAKWSTFFYDYVPNNTSTTTDEQNFHDRIATDIAAGVPVIVEGDTYYLPEWAYVHVLHYITVIGYDDSAKTYTYTDTCGKVCGGGKDGGLNTIDQHRLFSLVMNDSYVGSGNGGYIW